MIESSTFKKMMVEHCPNQSQTFWPPLLGAILARLQIFDVGVSPIGFLGPLTGSIDGPPHVFYLTHRFMLAGRRCLYCYSRHSLRG